MAEQTEPRGLERWLPVRWEVAAYVLLMAVALAMRLWGLGDRTMHHDESLHALYSWYIVEGRGYEHNPLLHGPFQFFSTSGVFFLFGDGDYTARLLYAVFGTALVGMPWLLRDRLGRTGALITALLLAFSPTLLYFSRFARNDIIMAVFTMGMVALIWSYLRHQRPRDLYLLSALLALAFTTKETVYLTVAGLGAFLALLSAQRWREEGWRWPRIGAPGALLLLLATLTLPQGVALIGLVQEPLGLVLANDDPAAGVVGLPYDAGRIVAIVLVVAALGVSAAVGLLWDWRRWLVCAGVFYSVWALLYSSLLTSPYGLASGMWRSLGYWVVQQDVGRGSQPWYYYFVAGGTYEFLPVLLALVGVFLVVRRGDLFGRFLLLWAVVNLGLFVIASEKMPWLLVHVTLPLILLAGRTAGQLVEMVPWGRAWRSSAVAGLALLPLLMAFSYHLLFFTPQSSLLGFLVLWGWLLLVFGMAAAVVYLAARVGRREGAALLVLGLASVLLILGVRTGWRATYLSGDVPTEILVYTQTGPDVSRIARDIGRISLGTGQGRSLRVTVDGDSGFSWPWAWYLRHYPVAYPNYTHSMPEEAPTSAIVMVSASNNEDVADLLGEDYVLVQRYKHRQWFPESYRGVTAGSFVRGLFDRATWRDVTDYWLFREFDAPLGSSDAYLYYSTEIERYIAERPG